MDLRCSNKQRLDFAGYMRVKSWMKRQVPPERVSNFNAIPFVDINNVAIVQVTQCGLGVATFQLRFRIETTFAGLQLQLGGKTILGKLLQLPAHIISTWYRNLSWYDVSSSVSWPLASDKEKVPTCSEAPNLSMTYQLRVWLSNLKFLSLSVRALKHVENNPGVKVSVLIILVEIYSNVWIIWNKSGPSKVSPFA